MPDYSEIQRILKEEDILEVLKKESQKLIVNEDIPIQIIWLVIFSSILIEKPFGVLIYSASSSGKSYIIKKILECIPEEFNAVKIDENGNITIKDGFGFVSLHDITLAALTRLASKNPRIFEGKILILHELPEDSSDETKMLYRALRQYFSDGSYSRILTDSKTGRPMLLNLEGYCCMISESAEKVIEEQWGNRFIFIDLDESKEQNKLIVEFQALKYKEPWNRKYPDLDLILGIFENYLCMYDEKDFKHVSVYNPWVKHWERYILEKYGDDHRIRRYFETLLSAVETNTRMHYKQRKKEIHESGFPILHATMRDNAKILYLFDQMLAHTLKSITSGAIQLLKFISNEFNDEDFKVADVHQASNISKSTIKKKIRMLKDYGLINHIRTDGKAYVYQISEKGKSSEFIGQYRTVTDAMAYFSELSEEEEPFNVGPVSPGVSLQDTLNPLSDNSKSLKEVVEHLDKKDIGPAPIESDIMKKRKRGGFRTDKALKEILELYECLNVEELSKKVVYRELRSKYRKFYLQKVINKAVNNGKLIESKPGFLTRR